MSAEYRLRVTKWRKFVVRVRLIEGSAESRCDLQKILEENFGTQTAVRLIQVSLYLRGGGVRDKPKGRLRGRLWDEDV